MKAKSFTLIELLVVIVIIGILAGVIIISTSSSIEKANLTKIDVFSNTIKNKLMLDMVGSWKLDEGTGTSITDSWNNNNGVLTGAAIWRTGTDCISGSCLEFPGVGMVTIPYASPSTLNELTVDLWIKVSSQDQHWEEFFKIGIDRIETGANGTFGLWTNGYTHSNIWKANEWFHLVYSSSATLNQTSIYINGNIIQDKAAYTNLPFVAGNILFGTCYSLESFSGFLDEVRIYNKYINADQAKSLFLESIAAKQ